LDRLVSRNLSGWDLQEFLYIEPILGEAHFPGCDQHEFSIVGAPCRERNQLRHREVTVSDHYLLTTLGECKVFAQPVS